MSRHCRRRLIVLAPHHDRAADLKHSRGAGAVDDHVEDQRRIEPRHLAEHKGFRRRQIVDRDEMVCSCKGTTSSIGPACNLQSARADIAPTALRLNAITASYSGMAIFVVVLGTQHLGPGPMP